MSDTKNKGGILSGVIGGLSQLGSGLFGYLGQKSANKTNIQLAREAREHDVNMWKMQNEYNTPAMQMQRLAEAGLNPHLMYGQGTTGNASSPQRSPVPEVQNELASLAQMSLAPIISMYQDWRVKNAQIDNLQANAEATRQNATLTAIKQITQDFMNKKLGEESYFWATDAANRSLRLQGDTELTRFKAKTAQQMFSEALPAQIQQIMLRNNLLEQQTRAYRLENEFNQELKPYGIRSTDPLWMRLIMHVLPKDILSDLPKIFGK
jgi:hypothetical protein